MSPLLEYFQKDVAPEDPQEAKRLRQETFMYTLISQHLYKRGFNFPLLRCLDTKEAKYVIHEVHEGVCRSHIGGRALEDKIAKVGIIGQ
ncbi:hypothetical protein CR513_56101, partial [Mucuna pruriens]